jgi:hypothetical protein
MADLSNVPWEQFPFEAKPEDLVSRDFNLLALTKSETAMRRGIKNAFTTPDELRFAVYVCRNIIQAVKDAHGQCQVNSVFRSQALERTLKKKPANWISKSQHTLGQACDLEVPGMATLGLAEWVAQNLAFDQVICELYNPAEGPNSGWVHVSVVPPSVRPNRGERLSYVLNPNTGEFEYVPGLVASR